jgi:rhodanese-related sulfurtransferase
METLTTAELQERLSSGGVALFDVRGDVEYEIGHIPGAKTAPLGSLAFRVADLMNPDSYVAVYSSGADGLATEAAQRLQNLKLRNVHCYEQGLKGWAAAGLPVVPSIDAKVDARGPVVECRNIIVDRETAYGGAFKGEPVNVEGAGG